MLFKINVTLISLRMDDHQPPHGADNFDMNWDDPLGPHHRGQHPVDVNTSGLHTHQFGPEGEFLNKLRTIVNGIINTPNDTSLNLSYIKNVCLSNPKGKGLVRYLMLDNFRAGAEHNWHWYDQNTFNHAASVFRYVFDEDLVPNPETYWQDLKKKYLTSQLENTLIHLKLLINRI